ncbi:hypothetical protein L798_14991 [Zootermopsis nevadensis]|uniref:Uncharacterized protein n=1 Tax=Zootermopsis nevadensis TaxID=136037 RepID=A0A067QLT6_ZOONE|nr:hypothetical protein L798_14991 [Zootermopsis nevadensis]
MARSLLPWLRHNYVKCVHTKDMQTIFPYADSLPSLAVLYQVCILATNKQKERERERERERAALSYPTVISPSPGRQDYASPQLQKQGTRRKLHQTSLFSHRHDRGHIKKDIPSVHETAR